MTVNDLEEIVSKKLKKNKACDIYYLTPKQLKYVGPRAFSLLCTFVSRVLRNLDLFSAPEFKTSIASVIYKGKSKPRNHHKSYRLVRVGSLIGRILDE